MGAEKNVAPGRVRRVWTAQQQVWRAWRAPETPADEVEAAVATRRRELNWRRWIAAAAVLLFAGGGLVVWWLTDMAAGGELRLRLEAARTAFTVAFSIGGLITLTLFARRQWQQEREHVHRVDDADRAHARADETVVDNRHDAEQKRITDLFIKAVDQLGSDKPAVRLGGVYALDRLGREHQDHRQDVIDMWCAYLRMTNPVNPTSASASGATGEAAGEVVREVTVSVEESQIQATIRRLLAARLRDPRPDTDRRKIAPPPQTKTYWGHRDIDLNHTRIPDLDLSRCHINTADFTNSLLTGETRFSGAVFAGDAGFGRAVFAGDVMFGGAVFAGSARFVGTVFAGDPWFGDAMFAEAAGFEGAVFAGLAWFGGAVFAGAAWFDDAVFAGLAWFDDAMFAGFARFDDAVFAGLARFGDAMFAETVEFEVAMFAETAACEGTVFAGNAGFDGVMFAETTGFRGTVFAETAGFGGVMFAGNAWFSGAVLAGDAGFDDAVIADGADADTAIFSGKVSFDGALRQGSASEQAPEGSVASA